MLLLPRQTNRLGASSGVGWSARAPDPNSYSNRLRRFQSELGPGAMGDTNPEPHNLHHHSGTGAGISHPPLRETAGSGLPDRYSDLSYAPYDPGDAHASKYECCICPTTLKPKDPGDAVRSHFTSVNLSPVLTDGHVTTLTRGSKVPHSVSLRVNTPTVFITDSRIIIRNHHSAIHSL